MNKLKKLKAKLTGLYESERIAAVERRTAAERRQNAERAALVERRLAGEKARREEKAAKTKPGEAGPSPMVVIVIR